MTLQSVSLAKPWKAKRALLGFCLEAVHRARDGAVRFVQVGANDGRLADPILPFIETGHWHGLMIEPHPAYFAELSRLHAGRAGIVPVNCAVSDAEGEMQLFHLAENQRAAYPAWARGCASLKRTRLEEVLAGQRLDGAPGDLARDIAAVEVPVRRLDAILAGAGIAALDILVIDVEGFELNVLNGVDLGALGLKACMVECNGSDAGGEAEIAGLLGAAGLVTFRLRDDLLGLHPGRLDVRLTDMLAFLGQTPVAAK